MALPFTYQGNLVIQSIGKNIVDMVRMKMSIYVQQLKKMKKYDKYEVDHKCKIKLVDWMEKWYYKNVDAEVLKENLESSLKSV